MEWNDELVEKFTFFHSCRMKGAYQTDNMFYVKQSMEIFVKLKGDITNFHFGIPHKEKN